MSNSKLLLSKVCNQCRQSKPISSFLLQSGKPGAVTYGNICAACRKLLENQETPEGAGGSSTGVRISSKTKVTDDIGKREHHDKVEELYHEDRDKDHELQIKQTDKTQSIAKEERKHRESFLEKRTFLDSSEKAKRAQASQVFGGEAHRAKASEIRLDAPFIDTQPKAKYGAIWRQFKDLLGTSAVGFGIEKQKATQQSDKSKKPAEKTVAEDKKRLNEIIEKDWSGPGSRKR